MFVCRTHETVEYIGWFCGCIFTYVFVFLRNHICMCVHQGMIQQLIDYNLRHGALSVRLEVRALLCLLTRDNRRATEEMNNLIMTRITAAVKGHQSNPDMVRHGHLYVLGGQTLDT